jgi:hypothetical protein
MTDETYAPSAPGVSKMDIEAYSSTNLSDHRRVIGIFKRSLHDQWPKVEPATKQDIACYSIGMTGPSAAILI